MDCGGYSTAENMRALRCRSDGMAARIYIGIIRAMIGCLLVGCPITSIMLNRSRAIVRATDVQQRYV